MISAKDANKKSQLTKQNRRIAFNISDDPIFRDLDAAIRRATMEAKFNITFELTEHQQSNVEFIIEELDEQGYYVQQNDKNHLYISWNQIF